MSICVALLMQRSQGACLEVLDGLEVLFEGLDVLDGLNVCDRLLPNGLTDPLGVELLKL